MKAITLPRPLPTAILHLGMTVLNQPEPCPLSPDEYFAIYASRRWDMAKANWIADRFGSEFSDRPEQHPTGIIAIARFTTTAKAYASLWWEGPLGWVFRDVVPMTPAIALPEQPGVWELPESILPTLRRQWKVAKASDATTQDQLPIPTGAVCLYSGIGSMKGRLVRVLGAYTPNPGDLHCEVLSGRDRAPTGETFGCHPDRLRQIHSPTKMVHRPTLW
jgi:hypothetical protein